ncbi:MAG: 2-polyprenyl-6-hydroxyphenyl methylase/3-demethylubiquinone-9 3-methyltransferase [Afipia broomeae]|jgi:2-polyprenyl-6-hydroxyphenyl methylase/3-demethylubiquinone-9 3-methyltransferase|nr:MAG: class I SAM-dependent methyltransferase [Bradyrhizobiaceae bacterium]
MSNEHLKKVDTHFAFGKNWASYSKLIDEPQIEQAKKGLLKLIPAEEFEGRSFLDIGCGSGLHALAAARLGAGRIVGVDIDPDSVNTAKNVLSSRNLETPWHIENTSVFDLDPKVLGTFDIVYSWGVLHHTGSMWEAVNKAAAMVSPNGLLAVALYRTTYMDPFWKFEKRLYSGAPAFVQECLKSSYIGAFRLANMIKRREDFQSYVKNYKSIRGMDFDHDVHDWLGGYPYETALAPEVDRWLTNLGFKAERVFARPKSSGVPSSGCDEYVYRLQK